MRWAAQTKPSLEVSIKGRPIKGWRWFTARPEASRRPNLEEAAKSLGSVRPKLALPGHFKEFFRRAVRHGAGCGQSRAEPHNLHA